MAYTNPTTRSTDEIITATDWNTDVVDNLRALKDPPTDSYVCNESADYTLTSTTFTDVDATNLSLSLTTTGGAVLVGFHGSFMHTGTARNLYLNLTVDGAVHAAEDGLLAARIDLGTAPGIPVSFVRLITGLAAGSHTINLTYKVSAASVTLFAGAGTSGADLHPQFWAREI